MDAESKEEPLPGLEPQPFAGTADVRCSLPAQPGMSPIGGAQAWAKQVWPYGKTTPVYSYTGAMRDAWGDLTRPPGTLLSRFSRDDLERMNKERAACAMPLLEVEGD